MRSLTHVTGTKMLAIACVPLTFALLASLASEARAANAESDEPRVKLRFATTATTGACANDEALRARVESRLGRVPFASSARDSLVVRIEAPTEGATTFRGHVGIDGAKGAKSLEGASCEALLAEVTSTLVLLLDNVLREPPPAPTTDDNGAREPPPPMARAPGSAKDAPATNANANAPKAMGLSVMAGGMVGGGTAPAVNTGVFAQIRVAATRVSIAAEGRADFPASAARSAGSVSTSLVLGGVAPCFHASVARVCALGYAGSLRGTGAKTDASFYAATGLRIGAEMMLGGGVFVHAHADGLVTLTRTTLNLDGRPAWETPPVSGALALGVGFQLF